MAPSFRKTIAAFEVIGGISGPCFVAYDLLTAHSTPADLIAAAVFSAIYIFALYAGVALWQDRRSGYICSAVVQIIQWPKILSAKVAFMMSFGVDFSAMLVSVPANNTFGVEYSLRFLCDHLLQIGDPSMPYGLGISLISCVVLMVFVDTFFRKKVRVPA